jgi:hypothetical protein
MPTVKNKKELLVNSIKEKVRVRKEIAKQAEEEQKRKLEQQHQMVREIKEYFQELPPYDYHANGVDDYAVVTIKVKESDVEIFLRTHNTASGQHLEDMKGVVYYDRVKSLYDNREKILEKIVEELK